MPPTVTRLDFIFMGSVTETFIDPSKKLSFSSLTLDSQGQTINTEFVPRRSKRLRDGSPATPSASPAPPPSSSTGSSNAQEVNESEYSFAKVFPNLDHFYLGAWHQDVPQYVFAQLPRSLNSFILWEMRCNVSSFADLPPQLTLLDLPYGAITAENVRTLPHTLTALGNRSKFDKEALRMLSEDPELLPNLKNRAQLKIS